MRRFFRRPKKITGPQFRANEWIRVPEVVVIDEAGKNLGTMPTSQAINMARERELDLVEVSPKEVPPITKFLDFGKFKYQKEKEARLQKAGAKKVEIKGIRLSPRIGDHDLEIRRKQAIRFLESGDKVQIEVNLKGRERQYTALAETVIRKFQDLISSQVSVRVEQPISRLGGRFTMLISKQ